MITFYPYDMFTIYTHVILFMYGEYFVGFFS